MNTVIDNTDPTGTVFMIQYAGYNVYTAYYPKAESGSERLEEYKRDFERAFAVKLSSALAGTPLLAGHAV